MDSNGKIHVGKRYIPRLDRLQEITAAKSHSEAIRIVLEELTTDADLKKIKTVPRRAIGIKTTNGATKMIRAATTPGA